MYVIIDEVLAGQSTFSRETQKNGQWRNRLRPFSAAPTFNRASSTVPIRAARQQRRESPEYRTKARMGKISHTNRNLLVGSYHSGSTLPSGRRVDNLSSRLVPRARAWGRALVHRSVILAGTAGRRTRRREEHVPTCTVDW